MKGSILLIAFKFPPYAGVGSKRWSKFSKYLVELGYKIHVVTVEWEQNGANTFLDDVNDQNIIIHRIPSGYPHNYKYRKYPSNFFGNLKRVMRYLLFKVIDTIWYEDEAQYWGYYLLPFCKRLISDEKIVNVIATGHPFMANYWAARLKEEVPAIHLIQDFRDPWNDNAFRPLPMIFKKKSVQHEIFAVNNCDTIITVTCGFLDLLSSRITQPIKKGVIPNGFDLPAFKGPRKQERNFSFLYAGDAFNGRDEPLEAFFQCLLICSSKIPEITLDIYGNIPQNLKTKYETLFKKGIVKIHSPVSPERILELICSSFICLSLNARATPSALSTKIYEYGSLRRPILCINYGGEISQFIVDHHLGYSVYGDDIDRLVAVIYDLYDLWRRDSQYETSPIDLNAFHYHALAQKVECFLK